MKNFTKQITYMGLLAFVILPVVSHAQSGAVLNGEVSIESDTLIENNLSSSTSVEMGTDAQMGVDGRTAAEQNSQAENDVNLNLNSSGVAIVSSSQVRSENDLEAFNANASVKSKAVSKVKMNSLDNEDESKIEVIYNQKGKFLGLFPIDVKIKAILEARANGQAEVRAKKPWFGFLITHENFNKNEIETRIRENTTVKTKAKVNASAQARAEIAEAIIAELDAYTQTQASLTN